jgi:hypothetical protein
MHQRDRLMVSDAKPNARARRLIAPAIAAYGERWQSPLARAAGVSQALLTKIAAGQRNVTDDVEDKCVAALLAEAERMGKAAVRVGELTGRIMAAREK